MDLFNRFFGFFYPPVPMLNVFLNNMKVQTGSYDSFLHEMFSLSKRRVSSFVCFANVHMAVEVWRDQTFAKIISKATIVCPDGKPLALLAGWVTKKPQDRVAGMDIVPKLISGACEKDLRVFFVGPNEETIAAIKGKVAMEFDNNIIAGYYIPPYSADACAYNEQIVKEVNESDADFVFVSLGCPKQERWMFNHYQSISVPLLGVGGALPVYAGLQKRAPAWMQRYSLEWLYRLIQEPGRLLKRYFLTNAIFIYNAFIVLAFNKFVVEKD